MSTSHRRIGLVLLAAGASARMGTAKQLLDYGGKPLIRHAAEQALQSGCDSVYAVVGCRADEVGAALHSLPVRILFNPDWELGMGTSVRVGAEAAEADGLDAVILALTDQPLVSPESYRRLIDAHRVHGVAVVASRYGGTLGVPALFARELFQSLLDLQPEHGARHLISAQAGVIEVPCPEAAVDLDTPADYERHGREMGIGVGTGS